MAALMYYPVVMAGTYFIGRNILYKGTSYVIDYVLNTNADPDIKDTHTVETIRGMLDTYKNLSTYYSNPYFPVNFIEIINRFDFLDFEQVVNNFKDLNINSIDLNHPGNCSGYSITSDKKKFCYLLDNEYEDIQEEKLIDFCDHSETIIWDGMFLESELSDKKGWGHSSIEQGITLADKIDVKNFLISHHSPSREDKEIKIIEKNISNKKVKFASENEVLEF